MAARRTDVDEVVRIFRAAKVLTLDDLALHLHRSPRSVQRRLRRCQVIHSYNHNGRYYTLADIPRFDADGLWQYRGIGFSRHGNLTQTVVGLIRHSPAGLTSSELGKLDGDHEQTLFWRSVS